MKEEQPYTRLCLYRSMVEAEAIVRLLQDGDISKAERLADRLLKILREWKEKMR